LTNVLQTSKSLNKNYKSSGKYFGSRSKFVWSKIK